MVHQRRHVLPPLAEGRQHDRQHVQPVVQVLAELAFVDELLEIALGPGDDAHVHRNRPGSADALHLPVLQRTQQLHLHREGHVVDIIEKQRATLCQLEPARLVLDGTGECAAFVAEELRLDQAFGKERAAHGNKWLVAARTLMVQEIGDDFLAGAAFPGDDDAAVAAAHDLDEIEDRAHPRALPDDDLVDRKMDWGSHDGSRADE